MVQGRIPQTYYSPEKFRDAMHGNDQQRKGAGWWREWPEAWAPIEPGHDNLDVTYQGLRNAHVGVPVKANKAKPRSSR